MATDRERPGRGFRHLLRKADIRAFLTILPQWEEASRGFQLLDVLLHELGHHYDLMTTRTQRDCARSEPYADQYAIRYQHVVWERYLRTFDLD